MEIVIKKVICASVSHAASDKAIYSASIVDNATVVCFRDVKDSGPPFNMKIYPVVDFRSISLNPQSASA